MNKGLVGLGLVGGLGVVVGVVVGVVGGLGVIVGVGVGLVVGLVVVVGVVVGLELVVDRGEPPISFFELITEGLQNKTINEREDLQFILNNLNEKRSNNLSLEYVLEKYLIFLRENKDELLIEHNDLIKNYIKKEKDITPYSNLPEYERSLFADLEKSLNSPNESLLNNLSEAIISREKKNTYLVSVNKWSTFIAIIGTLLSVILFIFYFAKPSLTQEELNTELKKYSITIDSTDSID